MALPPDDWVSTSPIAAPAPARIAKAVTPGRALTREEIRQQRRRGNPAYAVCMARATSGSQSYMDIASQIDLE